MEVVLGGRDIMLSYAYGVVSGLHGRLLKSRDYELFMTAESVKEILSTLEKTSYASGIRQLTGEYSLSEVEAVLSQSLRESYLELSGMVPEKERKALDLIVMGAWDLENIKSAVRAMRNGISQAQTYPVLGVISGQTLSEMVSSPGVEDMVSMLPEPYSTYLSSASLKESPMGFDEELDRSHIRHLLSSTKGELREYVGLLVDSLNLRAILRCKASDVDASSHVLEGGRHVKGGKLYDMLRSDLASEPKVLEGTPYHGAVRDSIKADGGVDFPSLEVGLRSAVESELEFKSKLEPVSIYSILSFLNLKRDEMFRLRAVIAGKWFEVGSDEVRVWIS
ncbi:MAG: hypothetical protein GF416_01700 [Candidatus Altiarchaeales archaeon]|nr:hypothetical protein [Candidatus Altiarchaeales archaeon]MBD3415830.1 hypothetical protein [Candidatus Altiarchaeales archaeon]